MMTVTARCTGGPYDGKDIVVLNPEYDANGEAICFAPIHDCQPDGKVAGTGSQNLADGTLTGSWIVGR